MLETTWQPFVGEVQDNSLLNFYAMPFQRLVQTVTLQVTDGGSAPTAAGGCQVQFQINGGALYPQVFVLPQGALTMQITVAGSGYLLAPGDVLTAKAVSAGGVLDLAVVLVYDTAQTGSADAWFVPTISTLQSAISAPEWATFTESYLKQGQSDPVPQIIANAVNEITTAIRTGSRNNIGPVGSIPGGALNLFLQTAQWYFFKTVKSLTIADNALKEMREWANAEIEKICEGKRKFIQPTNPSEVTLTGMWSSEAYVKVDPNEIDVSMDDGVSPPNITISSPPVYGCGLANMGTL